MAVCPAEVVEWSKALYPAKAAGRAANEMAYVYILQDELSRRYYIGSCVNLDLRLRRHERHTATLTTRNGMWSLVCYMQLPDLSQARVVERKIKSYKSGNAFKKIINGGVVGWIFEM